MILPFCLLFLSSFARTYGTSWRPIVPHSGPSILQQEPSIYGNSPVQALYEDGLVSHDQDRCALYKVSMNQQLYFEYIQYKTSIPDLKEFTLCMWTKFHNHTNDHPLFSYAVGDQPRGILSWVANTARSSYYMMNIDGHNLYRLNYPLRLNKWYHSCQSWNGRTGEWQIWVNDERVGRGYNNRLVGHVIKGGGIAISGQEQRQLGGGFLEGEGAPPGAGGMLGELTMVQFYNVALTAGKAHRDHKHHHAHHYEHDTSNNTPRSTTRAPVTGPPLPPNPFLTGGQINPSIKLNPGSPVQIVQNGVTLRHPAVSPIQIPQSFPPVNPESLSTGFPVLPSLPRPLPTVQMFPNIQQLPAENNIAGGSFGFIDPTYHNLFKREKNLFKRQSDKGEAEVEEPEEKKLSEKSIAKRDAEESTADKVDTKVSFVPREKSEDVQEKKIEKRESEKKKRGIIQFADGVILDDGYSSVPQGLDNDYFSGLASFGLQLPEHETKDEEREPAEYEVRQVMDICDGCADEPFEKALIMGWRSVPKKLYSGALHVPALQTCKAF